MYSWRDSHKQVAKKSSQFEPEAESDVASRWKTAASGKLLALHQMDRRRRIIWEFGKESRKLNKEQLKKQKVTQKLGLDFHIFDKEEDLMPRVQLEQAATTKAAPSHSLLPEPKNRKANDSLSQISLKTGGRASHPETASPGKRKEEGNGGSFEMGSAQKGIVTKIDAYKARKEPLPFGMDAKIWRLDDYKSDFDKFKDVFKKIAERYAEDEKRLL